jgi:glycine dehydrogenase subunit 1
LVSRGIHPDYRSVVATYLRGGGRGRVEELGLTEEGATDLAALEAAMDDDVAAVCVGYPNFYGIIDDLDAVSLIAQRGGALAVSATSEALALALLRAPGDCGVDVAVAEGQSLGLPISYGGPGVGLFATRRDFVRQMPGRLVGQTIDEHDHRGFVLTLATREQHIRREKATSNICTNQGLAALAVTVFLGLAGRTGLRALALENTAQAHAVVARLKAECGLAPVLSGSFFNEFVVEEPARDGWFREALAKGVIPGVRLGRLMPKDPWAQRKLLITVTECNTPDQVDALIGSLAVRRAA